MRFVRSAAFAAASLLVLASDASAQACVGGPRLGASTRITYGTGSLETAEGGSTAALELGLAGQFKVVAGMSIEYSTFLGEGDFTSTNLTYMLGPVLDKQDRKGFCAIVGLGLTNLGDFENAGRGRAFIGGSYGMEVPSSFGALVPFGSLIIDYSSYGGADLDTPLNPLTIALIEAGSGFRLENGVNLRASLRTSTADNATTSLRLAATIPFTRFTK